MNQPIAADSEFPRGGLEVDRTGESAAADPMLILEAWLERASQGEEPSPAAMTLVTATADGAPSARVVSLKRLESDALVFTSALWTRKVRELLANPQVAAVFYWPSLGRQVRLSGRAEIAERALAEELFAKRPRSHQLQTHVSRQGDPITDLEQLRADLAALKDQAARHPLAPPQQWGAIRIHPQSVEFWQEGPERLHDRLLFEGHGELWRRSRLAP
jgi:pyridoxamine 5'-phosphate oxidase